MTSQHQQLIQTVQHNCNISDAKHAGNYTMCVYLLKMREYFRWEQSNSFTEPLSTDSIGNWLSSREALWAQLENEEYRQLETGNEHYDPFDSAALNHILNPDGLVYSGGYGVKSKPHFFIAQLQQQQKHNGYTIYISDREYARDLTSPPAMSHDKTIFIRRESFKRMIWERTEEWRWHKPENAMACAIACYDFDNDLDGALDAMTDNELNAAVLHEIGEIQAGETLDGWQEMMNHISFTQAEIMARAVRDHFADTLQTLPALLDNNASDKDQQASLHFYFANLTNMRKHLFPSLMTAYRQWREQGNIEPLHECVDQGRQHWRKLARDVLDLHQQTSADRKHLARQIESLVSTSHL